MVSNSLDGKATRTQERPVVSVQAQTANTTGVKIIANGGTAWLVISHDCITIKSSGLEVEVRP